MSRKSVLILALLAIAACSSKPGLREGEGYLDTDGGKVWYEVKGTGPKTPVVLLHGGPGSSSNYLIPLMTLAADRPVIRFDQLGSGKSDRISDTTLMTVEHYAAEVHRLLEKLGVREYYLYGHSWGTMLGADFCLRYPAGIKGVIFASPCLSSARWVSDADTLISALPDSIQTTLRESIRGVVKDSLKLKRAVDVYAGEYYTRHKGSNSGLEEANMSRNVYHYMWGDNEFFATGTLRSFDRTADLKKITVPVLYITGEYDAARPATVRYYQKLTPGSQLVIIPGSGHTTMNDNPEADRRAIGDFLNGLDARK